jgi:hypothetical protein
MRPEAYRGARLEQIRHIILIKTLVLSMYRQHNGMEQPWLCNSFRKGKGRRKKLTTTGRREGSIKDKIS